MPELPLGGCSHRTRKTIQTGEDEVMICWQCAENKITDGAAHKAVCPGPSAEAACRMLLLMFGEATAKRDWDALVETVAEDSSTLTACVDIARAAFALPADPPSDLATLRRERDEAREALRSEHHTLTKLRLKENFDAVESIEASQSWHAAEDPLRALPVPAAPKAPTERPIGGQGNANDA